MSAAQPKETVKIALLDDYQHLATTLCPSLAQLPNLDIFNAPTSEVELAEKLQPYQVICTMRERTPFPRSLLERLPNLKLITTTGMGNRSFDLKAMEERGIVVLGTGGVGNGTLELIWTMILGGWRNVGREDASMREGKWTVEGLMGRDLSGATLGLVGYGRLGQRTAKIARAFDMNVQAWSPNLTQERIDSSLEPSTSLSPSLSSLLSSSDIISLHMVLSPSTKKMIGKQEFAAMKSEALFVNTSRGGLVDEEEMIGALKEGVIGSAALDVYATEPLPEDSELRKLKNVLLSPHMGYVTRENMTVFYQQTVENVQDWLAGKVQPKRVIHS